MLLTVKAKPKLLSPELLTASQNTAIDQLYNYDESILIANMGAGKTVISLTAIAELIAAGELNRVLVFAPLKVCQTVWRQERDKWTHLSKLNVEVCGGSPAQRVKTLGAFTQGIMVINFDVMAWFFSTYKKDHGFEGILIDELSKMKGGGAGFKKMRRYLDTFRWRVGMTGTPVAEDFEGLFYQTFCVDAGKRFGGNKQKFLETFFFQADFQGYTYELQRDGAGRIMGLLQDLIHVVPDYRGELPELISEVVYVDLPEDARALYKEMSKNGEITTSEGVQAADNAAVLSGKLEQIASGALYNVDEWGERVSTERVHEAKLSAVAELVHRINAPVIICYWYSHELERLKERFPTALDLKQVGAMERWNNGEIAILLLQPMSASHGIELQFGGHNMIYLKPIWSNDIKSQCDARIWRKGQLSAVTVYEIVARDTVDEMIIDRVEGKKKFEELFNALVR